MGKPRTLELLAPAGSPEKAQHAFAYGADAVYLGIPDFSMRVRINRFTMESLKEIIDYAHSIGKKAYVTINIYAHNEHLTRLPKYLKELNKWKPDALIISDPGILQLVKEHAPDLPFHVSTQANVTNWQAAKFWRDQGAERVILGREVTLEEIKEMHERMPELELEYFVHGAMCMAYSGRCMLSAWLTGRSANLGDCAQPCRWRYTAQDAKMHVLETELEEPLRPGVKIPVEQDTHGTYIFNSKDMCLIEHLPKLIDAGMISFKIEGRAKSVAYLSSVVKAYRQALDFLKDTPNTNPTKYLKDLRERFLDTLVHRGYTTGFMFGRETVEQNIDDSHVGGEMQFVGEILDSVEKNDKWDIIVRPHNALRVGDSVRIMQPTKEDLQFVIEHLYNEEAEEIQSLSGGAGKNAVLQLDSDVEKMGIVFKMRESAK